jgi:5-methylcytosine-specific restriction endonuclease McrA
MTKNQKRKTAAIRQRDEAMKRIAELRAMPYSDYLRSGHWGRKRQAALRHHGERCNRCDAVNDLQVHHKTYDRRGNERMKDLEVLCADCHAGEHQHDKPWIEDSLTREFLAIFGAAG